VTEENHDLQQLPKGWTLAQLRDVYVDKSRAIVPNKMPEEMFELYSVPSFDNGKPEIVSGKEIGSNKQVVEEETVLLCKINPRINRVWIVGNHSPYMKIASTEWIPFFRLKEINPKYLSYFMRNSDFRAFLSLNVSGVGGSLMRIKASTIAEYPIPLAPFNEQVRIVARLEELFTRLDAGVEGLRKVKAQLKRYRQAVLKYAFEGKLTEEWRKTHRHEGEPVAKLLEGLKQKRVSDRRFRDQQIDATGLAELPDAWEWVPLGNLVTFKNGINFKSEQKGDKGILTIDVLNMYSDSIYVKLDNLYRVNINLKDDYFLRPGDILLVRSSVKREGVGWATAFKGSSEPVTFCGFIIRARLQDTRILPGYLTYYLRSNLARNRIIGSSSQVVITNISQGSFGKIPVPISPPAEQAKIVEEIERYYSLAFQTEDIINRSIRQAESLKRNILKTAFDGKLVPQDPSDEPAEKLLERIREEKEKSTGEKDINKKKIKPKQLELSTYVK